MQEIGATYPKAMCKNNRSDCTYEPSENDINANIPESKMIYDALFLAEMKNVAPKFVYMKSSMAGFSSWNHHRTL